MVASAPRIPRRLLDEIERQARRRVPIAEINRAVGMTAARLRFHRPSYEQVRVHVHAARRAMQAARRRAVVLRLDLSFGIALSWTAGDRRSARPALERRNRPPPS
ncbi:MAG TPA: hypothetical protein VFJ77_07925 [Gaiellaceae bacterium]|nr:hypothetical protein [Gaiellaceae bacterium]